tara:strand:- start:27114 stop:27851 length:738 start_codon:yes stop_codon:yes gene_type:complete
MKKRLDLILIEEKYCSSRNKAQVHILAGEVFVNGNKECVPSKLIDTNSTIEMKYLSDIFVSRAGEKLFSAIENFNIDIKDKICIDVGASTGGFTQCLLQAGAKKVYSVDVGYGQLDYKLRSDSRIVNLEKTNARNLDLSTISDNIDVIVMDVSFVSITKFDRFFYNFVKDKKKNVFIGLIKPQFELSKEKIGKNGIVRNSSYRQEAVKKVVGFIKDYYTFVSSPIESPIKGAKGNIEYLIYCKNN